MKVTIIGHTLPRINEKQLKAEIETLGFAVKLGFIDGQLFKDGWPYNEQLKAPEGLRVPVQKDVPYNQPAIIEVWLDGEAEEQAVIDIVGAHSPAETTGEERARQAVERVSNHPVIQDILSRLEALENA